MNEQLHETIKEIKKSLRLSMNGIVSAHQRKQGLNYKINFGVEVPRIKEIAKHYPQDAALAQELWKDNIRECKLLAIFLHPTKDFNSDTADKWIAECPFTEIADHLCRILLKNLPEAKSKALALTTQSNEMARYCGYSTLSNLFREGIELDANEQKAYMTAIKATLHSPGDTTTLQNSASISLIKFSEQKSGQAAEVCKEIKAWGIEERPALMQLVANIEEEL